ncbi:uncharacterized protein LOC143348430 [Colletes latitarsis]|uniref:uncharacterized protein LOC143348430 n=1 Tax=Colletes latitarsis TaxID=2605962 RepID=UPI0040368485
MTFQLDDLLKEDRKDTNLVPDLSKATCESREEFRRLLENCPEFKIKPEKVKRDDTKVRDRDFSWRATKKESKALGREWSYGNPVPPDMRSLSLRELHQVPIDWRMLTPVRPKLRQDEEMFSRLVEMGKLEAKTISRERRSTTSPIRRTKNRAGIIESSVKVCSDCGEEFCSGEFCGDILYDSFIRVPVTSHRVKVKLSADTEAIIANLDRKKRKKNKSTRRKSRRKRKKPKKDNGERNEPGTKQNKPFKRKCGKFNRNAK